MARGAAVVVVRVPQSEGAPRRRTESSRHRDPENPADARGYPDRKRSRLTRGLDADQVANPWITAESCVPRGAWIRLQQALGGRAPAVSMIEPQYQRPADNIMSGAMREPPR